MALKSVDFPAHWDPQLPPGRRGNDEIHILQDNLAIVQDCYMPDFHPGWIFGYGLLFFHELLSNSSAQLPCNAATMALVLYRIISK